MRYRMLLGLFGVTLPFAACGSSSSSSGTAAANQNYTKSLAFAACMRTHGVPNFPDPPANDTGEVRFKSVNGITSVNGVQINAPAFQAAMQACRSRLPNGGQPRPLSASRRQAMLQYSRCMRSHGVPSFPDPTFSGGGVLLRVGRDVASSPAFQSAQQACAAVLRKASPQGTGVGGPP
jgi:hypothetical protein